MVKMKKTKRANGKTQIGVRIPNDLLNLINKEIESLKQTQQISVTKQSIVLASIRSRYQNQQSSEVMQG